MASRAWRSLSGRRMPMRSASSASSTIGTSRRRRSSSGLRLASGKASCPASARALCTSTASSRASRASASTRPIPTATRPSFDRAPHRSCGISASTPGADQEWRDHRRRAAGAPGAHQHLRGASRVLEARPRNPGLSSVIATWPSNWPSTARRWAIRTSSSCRSPSTPTIRRGATRRSATTRRRVASAHPTTSRRLSTSCTRPASACCSIGSRPISRATPTVWPTSTAPRCTSMPIRARASTPTGAPRSSTTVATKCARSSSRTRCSGSRSTTSTACGWTRWRPCCTWITRAKKASGSRTATAAARTWRRSRSCSA